MEKLGTICKNGHAQYHDGCMECLELAMGHDAQVRAEGRPSSVEYTGPTAEMISKVIVVLVQHAGECGEAEGAVEVAQRLSAFWRSKHGPRGEELPARTHAQPPPVCTGVGLSPIDVLGGITQTEGTCGICGKRVGTRLTILGVVTVVHPYYLR